jgi:hypothetical protein
MKAKDVVLSIVDLIIWYFFAYYAVYLIQNPTLANPWWAALVLLVLGALGTSLCPWFQNTDAWRRMLRGKD